MIGVGTTLNERFTLDLELGQGGMGTVYRAVDRVLGRNVAIKLLKESSADDVARTIRLEAQILARFVHEKIVRLYDFGESEGNCFLVMEEVEGSSFSKRWRDLLLDDRLRVCGEVAEALEYAHRQGVIHRDVKPGNVLLTSSDAAKLSDFGLSYVADDRKDQSGTVRGTPRYMSPEQAQGKPLDHRTDLYSVGVMLYECATGDVPFVGNALSVMSQHVNAEPSAPRFKNPEISSTLDNLILSLLEKSPSKRPASGQVVALALVEEAERARRLGRITPGLSRSDFQIPIRPSPSQTLTVSEWKPGPDPESGKSRVDPRTRDSPSVEAPGAAPVSHSATIESPTPPVKEHDPSTRTVSPNQFASSDHPVALEMLTTILGSPIVISPEERYLCGHYLAYLLGGSRRRGIFRKRTLDSRNSNRARLLLAMAWLSSVEPTQESIELASLLLEDRPDVRAALSPVVVMKYLAGRDTTARRKRFRQVRKRLQEASAYAKMAMLDVRGVLNPGLMPGNLGDLAKIAPPLERLDAHRVSLWNRVAEVWRQDDDFRQAVLRYARRSDNLDEASADLWPEVVYPLIERAHWQRTFRPRHEAIWDYIVGKLLHFPVPGVRLDRIMVIAIPIEVAVQLDADLSTFVDDPRLDEDEPGFTEGQTTDVKRPFYVGSTIPREEPPTDDAPRVKVMVHLSSPDPYVFAQDTLRNLWEGALEAQDNAGRPRMVHPTIPVGPYRLAIIPTARGRSAIRAVLQSLHLGKEIEIMTPVLPRGSASRSVIAIWLYQDGSVVIVHLDFQLKQRFIFWHAPKAHQFNFAYPAELKHSLSIDYLEVPDQLDGIFSKK